MSLANRVVRILGAVAILALALLQFGGGGGGGRGAAAQAAATPLEIDGTGAGEVGQLLTNWATAFYASPKGLSLSYLPKGDRDGRLAFSRGEDDFVITGRPFTDADKANLAARNVGTIEAPIAVSAMAFMASAPYGGPLTTQSCDPNNPDAPCTSAPFTDPLRIPNDLLARTMLSVETNNWIDPEFTSLIAPLTLRPPIRGLTPVVRSDPSAMNYYLETFADTVAKSVYNQKLHDEVQLGPDVISEDWPFLTSPSRTGDDALGSLVGGWQDPSGSAVPQGGAVAPVSPSQLTDQIAQQLTKVAPNIPTPLYPIQVQNGAGEWVAPTPASITTAAAAGGGTPLYGLTQNVPGAYPLTWISSIEVPSSGLSPEKATALATLIRYGVTQGQKATAALGEGSLPAPLVAKALDAADQIIAGNCVGTDRQVSTVGDGGPYWPTGAAAPASSRICSGIATPGATTTTTTFVGPASNQPALAPPLVTSAPVGALTAPSSSGLAAPATIPSVSSATTAESAVLGATESNPSNPSSAVATTTPGTGTSIQATPVATSLPMPLPDDGRYGLDRLATAILGGAAFMLVRSALRRRGVSVAS